MNKSGGILLTLIGFVFLLVRCSNADTPIENVGDQAWLNLHDTVKYVGMETCRSCHNDKFETFVETGMGMSFGKAEKERSSGVFHSLHPVFDKHSNLYYLPFWQNDSMFVREFRINDKKDTVHNRVEYIQYIIGSGQHTNSHLININGYVYQAPITFYTQKRRWDLAPGFENGASSRFTRLIEMECMSCHNAYPDFVPGSQNKYLTIKTGIDCERCHGPGSLHVAEKQQGIIIDTSKGPDYSIVNPRRLSVELQNNVCQRCHLQGIAVLNDGKTFFDFRPGMKLSEVMNVFMPQYEGARDKMIMASHVERMKKSPCYLNSGQLSCISCHNPHVSVKNTPRSQYNNACISCHSGSKPKEPACTEDRMVRAAKNDDCARCHMPSNESIDIPHVAVTDHYIRRRPLADTAEPAITAFLGLQSFNNDDVDDITKARAYMEFFDRYNPNRGLIDSALYYLNRDQQREATEKQNRDFIRAYYALGDFQRVAGYAAELQPAQISDAWTAYRIGEAFSQLNRPADALPWLKRATEIWPYSLDFQNKYSIGLAAVQRHAEAMEVNRFVAKENPQFVPAQVNLGFLNMMQNRFTEAYEHLSRALSLDPDNEQGLVNMAAWLHHNGQDGRARRVLEHLLSRNPDHAQARAMLADLR